jgi:hypothetical protein
MSGIASRHARARPDGLVLEWRFTAGGGGGLGTDGGVTLLPFLIGWGQTEHPALTAPAGCILLSLRAEDQDSGTARAEDQDSGTARAEDQDSGTARAKLEALGVDLEVALGLQPALVATIDTPNGHIELR